MLNAVGIYHYQRHCTLIQNLTDLSKINYKKWNICPSKHYLYTYFWIKMNMQCVLLQEVATKRQRYSKPAYFRPNCITLRKILKFKLCHVNTTYSATEFENAIITNAKIYRIPSNLLAVFTSGAKIIDRVIRETALNPGAMFFIAGCNEQLCLPEPWKKIDDSCCLSFSRKT